MLSPDLVKWLQERTALSILDQKVLKTIAPLLQEQIIPANQTVVVEDTSPEKLYILRSGHLESNSKIS